MKNNENKKNSKFLKTVGTVGLLTLISTLVFSLCSVFEVAKIPEGWSQDLTEALQSNASFSYFDNTQEF